MKQGGGSQQRHEGAGREGGGGIGSTLWAAESDPPPSLPPLGSDWRQSVLAAWAEGRDGWGVGAKEWEVIGGALHWLTKRQCTKIKPVGWKMAQSFYTSSPSTKRTAEITKNDICFISDVDLSHFVFYLTHPNFLLVSLSLIRTFFLSLPVSVT